MACNECDAPQSATTVINNALSADSIVQESLVLDADKKCTCTDLPAASFMMVFLAGHLRKYGTDFTVDFVTGIVTVGAGAEGNEVTLVYIKA